MHRGPIANRGKRRGAHAELVGDPLLGEFGEVQLQGPTSPLGEALRCGRFWVIVLLPLGYRPNPPAPAEI